jgi:hypothetical protein
MIKLLFSRFFNLLYWHTKIKIFRIISNMLARGARIIFSEVIFYITNISDL